MHLLYCDETNLDAREGQFFIYGGLVIPCDIAMRLSRRIDTIRKDMQIPCDCPLKFNPCPPNLDHAAFIDTKRRVIESAIRENVVVIVSLILREIPENTRRARIHEINRVLFNYDILLHQRNDYGIALVDRFEDPEIDAHLRFKFQSGLQWYDTSNTTRLYRILGVHYSAAGQSHYCSIADIVLGTFRWAVNASTGGSGREKRTAESLIRLLSPLFLRNDAGNVSRLSLNFSPRTIRVPAYYNRYLLLKEFLAMSDLPTAQELQFVS